MNGTEPVVAAIELGGTKCIAAIARGRDILARERWPTGAPDETLGAILDWIGSSGEAIAAIGVAGFGPLNLDRSRGDYGTIGTTPKPGWSGVDLRGAFADAFDLPIGFDTDVAGAALAEGRWGAAQGCSDHVYLTIGTGVGGGIVAGGVPLHGAAHPEVGHIRVRNASADGFAGACPFHGDCIEGLVAGGSLAKRTGMKGEDIPPDHPVWAEAAQEIAELVAMLVLTVAPQRIVIGGGIGAGQPQLFPMIRAATVRALAGYGPISDAAAIAALVVPPGLGSDAGPLGAVALAVEALGDALSAPQ